MMSIVRLSKLKPIIGALLLLGILGVGVISTWSMAGHSSMAHPGCAGLNAGVLPCLTLVDLSACVQLHLGILQTVTRVVPTDLNQLLVLLIITIALWFVFKRKRSEPDALSRLRLQYWNLYASHNILFKKIGYWLILHEKRDPALTSWDGVWSLAALAR